MKSLSALASLPAGPIGTSDLVLVRRNGIDYRASRDQLVSAIAPLIGPEVDTNLVAFKRRLDPFASKAELNTALATLSDGIYSVEHDESIDNSPASEYRVNAHVATLRYSGVVKRGDANAMNQGLADYINSSVPSVSGFGAKCDGVTDDTAAINFALANKGRVRIPRGGICKVTSILIPIFACLEGSWAPMNEGGAADHSTIIGTAGYSAIGFAAPPNGQYWNSLGVQRLHILGGTRAIDLGDTYGCTNLVIRDVRCSGQVEESLYLGKWMERCVFEHAELLGGKYGFRINNNGTVDNYMDKCEWTSVRFSGSINGMNCQPNRASTGNTFKNLVFNGCGQSAIVANGNCADWDLINPGFENNCYTGPAPALTTATTVAANPVVAVASAANLVVGQTLTIRGAGVGGADWYPVIAAGGIAGLNITMTANAPVAVAAAELTNAIYDEVVGGNGWRCSGGYWGTNTRVRYSIASPSSASIFSGVKFGRPMYDPQMRPSIVNCQGEVRTLTNIPGISNAYQTLRTPDINPGQLSRAHAIYPGQPGVGTILSLRGTGAAEGAAPFGKLDVVTTDGNRSLQFRVDPDLKTVYAGPLAAGWNLTLAGGTVGNGTGVLAMNNATAAPSANGNGAIIYPEAGSLKCRTQGGNVVVMAPNAKAAVPAAATDAATTMALANALRTLLISIGHAV